MLEHDSDLILPSFGDGDFVPRVHAGANQSQLRGSRAASMHGNTFAELYFLFPTEPPSGFHQIGLRYMPRRRTEAIRELTVVGQEKQTLARIIQAPNRIDALAETLEVVHDRVTSFGIFRRCDDVLGFVECDIDVVLRCFQALPVKLDLIRPEICLRAQLRNCAAVYRHTAREDKFFSLSAARDASVREDFLQPFLSHST